MLTLPILNSPTQWPAEVGTSVRTSSVIKLCKQLVGALDDEWRRDELTLAYDDAFLLEHLTELLPG